MVDQWRTRLKRVPFPLSRIKEMLLLKPIDKPEKNQLDIEIINA